MRGNVANSEMKIEQLPLGALKRYENNPRNNAHAVKHIAKSIETYGFLQPIVIDKHGVIVAGDTRYQAAQQLNLETVPCVRASDLSDDQIRQFRILDNKLNEIAEWNTSLLQVELDKLFDFNFGDFGISFDDLLGSSNSKPVTDTIYNTKIKGPIYEPRGDRPDVTALYDLTKFNQLSERIEKSNAPGPVKTFLRWAAHRHVVFDYQMIAEFYAHADAEVQELMEDSALVIIDFEKAIEKGFTALSDEIAAGYLEGSKKDDDDE